MKFKVLIGPHIENWRRYKVGEVVETNRNLAEQFGEAWSYDADGNKVAMIKPARFVATDEPASAGELLPEPEQKKK